MRFENRIDMDMVHTGEGDEFVSFIHEYLSDIETMLGVEVVVDETVEEEMDEWYNDEDLTIEARADTDKGRVTFLFGNTVFADDYHGYDERAVSIEFGDEKVLHRSRPHGSGPGWHESAGWVLESKKKLEEWLGPRDGRVSGMGHVARELKRIASELEAT